MAGEGTSPALGWSVTLGSLVQAHLLGSGSDDPIAPRQTADPSHPPRLPTRHGAPDLHSGPGRLTRHSRTNLFVDLATNSLVHRPSSAFTLVTGHIDLSPRPLGILSLSRQVALFPVLAAWCSDTCNSPGAPCTGTVAGANVARVDFRAGREPLLANTCRHHQCPPHSSPTSRRPTQPTRRFSSPPRFPTDITVRISFTVAARDPVYAGSGRILDPRRSNPCSTERGRPRTRDRSARRAQGPFPQVAETPSKEKGAGHPHRPLSSSLQSVSFLSSTESSPRAVKSSSTYARAALTIRPRSAVTP
jgi:hypothetical protein